MLRREGGYASSGIKAEVFFANNKKRRGDRKNQSCTFCVTESQHNATKEMRGSTFIQSSRRKGDVRNSWKIRGDGGSVETST